MINVCAELGLAQGKPGANKTSAELPEPGIAMKRTRLAAQALAKPAAVPNGALFALWCLYVP
jgi:hypothetical protein